MKAATAVQCHWEKAEHPGPIRYRDRELQRDCLKVLPGGYYVTGEDLLLVTVLGSCVAACVRDAQTGLGGMNHFMLPGVEGGGESARYGAYAMEVLINELLKQGARREHLEAKVFGGANVMGSTKATNVGASNAAFVLDYLRAEQIHVLARDLGGFAARKVGYAPQTGRVLVKHVPMSSQAADLAAERAYGAQLQRQPLAGDIELFD